MPRPDLAERLLRRALGFLLPRAFAEEWGEEIVTTTLERADDARSDGVTALVGFTLREAVCLAALALRARRRPAAAPSRRTPMLTDPEDTRRYRIAWAVALAVHFAAFAVVFPFGGGRLEATPERELTVITRYHPPKPPERVETEVVKRRARAVPIPDPTPDAPEPIVAEIENIVVDPGERADVEFSVAAPSAPPVVTPEQEVFRVGAEVRRPAQLVRVQPEYPELARRARLECTVILETRIDRQGAVTDVEVLRGCGLGLDEAAVHAVSQWRYAPTTVNGRPVEVAMTVTVVFRLQ